jgi:glycosyltransferase involved in cell wall biosynthesis
MKCLKSILELDYPRSRFEVVVVDGGSTDGTPDIPQEFPRTRFVVEKTRGLAHARNVGTRLAKGLVVAYTDDDCTVDSQWLKKIIEAFGVSESVMCVCGPVFPLNPEMIPERLLINPVLGLYYDGSKVKYTQGLVTSNSAFKREVFYKIKFNENLGVTRKKGLLFGGEDDMIGLDLTDAGYNILYTPYAKVYHNIPTKRLRIQYVVKHALHGGISQAKIQMERRNPRLRCIRYALSNLAQSYFASIPDRSLQNCYSLVYYFSTLVALIVSFDRVLGNVAN